MEIPVTHCESGQTVVVDVDADGTVACLKEAACLQLLNSRVDPSLCRLMKGTGVALGSNTTPLSNVDVENGEHLYLEVAEATNMTEYVERIARDRYDVQVFQSTSQYFFFFIRSKPQNGGLHGCPPLHPIIPYTATRALCISTLPP